MSLLINLPNRNTDRLIEKLMGLLPGESIEVWPNIKSPDQVEMALVWQHEPGSLNNLPNLKGIQSFGAGVDFIMNDINRPNVPIARIIDESLQSSMANYVLTMINHHRYHLKTYATNQQQAIWKPKGLARGNVVAVLGFGQLGQYVSEWLIQAGFEVNAWSRTEKQHKSIKTFFGEEGLKQTVVNADYLVCLLPLTLKTRGILNKSLFNICKDNLVLINVARGGHLNERDLIEALATGGISHAYLDVFEQEPLPKEHPFWELEKVTITPHISAVTNLSTALEQIAENYRLIKNNQPMKNQVNQNTGY